MRAKRRKSSVYLASAPGRIRKARCPRCRKLVDGATSISDRDQGRIMPKPGDFAVCVYCGAFNCYTDDLRLRDATSEELATMPPRVADLVEIAAWGCLQLRKKNPSWTSS